MTKDNIAIRNSPLGVMAVSLLQIAVRRKGVEAGLATRNALGFVGSGLVQIGMLATLCLGVPEFVRSDLTLNARTAAHPVGLPAGRPGERRQQELKQFASATEITLKQPAFSV